METPKKSTFNLSTRRRIADLIERAKIPKCLHTENEKGAAAVEFAFALLALFFFFAVYMQFIQIFLAHEKLVFTGFTAARTHAVRGQTPARRAAEAIDADARLVFDAKTVHLRKNISIPAKLSKIFSHEGGKFVIMHRSPFFDELKLKDKLKGDN